MSMIVDTFRKSKRKLPNHLVLFESGLVAWFILEDAHEVSRLLGEPLTKDANMGCEVVSFALARVQEVVSKLVLLNRNLVAFKREDAPPRRWIAISLESQADISKMEFASDVAHEDALAELKEGKMESNWMWFTFPRMAQDEHGFRTLRESRLFFKRKRLAARTRECVGVLLSHQGKSAEGMFGVEGASHLKASATLFALTAQDANDKEQFALVLNRFFGGEQDEETVETIKRELEFPRDDTPKDLFMEVAKGAISLSS